MKPPGFLVIPFLLVASTQERDEKQRVKLEVPDADVIEIEFPKDWEVKKVQPPGGLPPTLRVSPPKRSEMSLQITVMADKEGRFSTPEQIRKTAEMANQRYVAGSVEKKMDLIAMESKTGRGYYASFTDASLVDVSPVPEGKYLKVSSGIFVIGKSAAAFTLLFNAGGETHQKAGLESIARMQKQERK